MGDSSQARVSGFDLILGSITQDILLSSNCEFSLGSGGTSKTNVGGPSSSFGVWHEYIASAQAICEKYDLKVTKIHTHIGSGSDPLVWANAANLSLKIVNSFPDVTVLNLGEYLCSIIYSYL